MSIQFIILFNFLILFQRGAILDATDVPIPKQDESLAAIPNWELKPSGYKAGDFVKYDGNVFKADYWAKNQPGKNPKPAQGWSLYQQIYTETQMFGVTDQSRVIGYLPSWKTTYNYSDVDQYKSLTHLIVAFVQYSSTTEGQLDSQSLSNVTNVVRTIQQQNLQNRGVSLMVAIGGANDYAFNTLCEKIGNSKDPESLAKIYIKPIINLFLTLHLDGIDFDLQCWWDPSGDPKKDRGGRARSNGPHPAGIGLTYLIKELLNQYQNFGKTGFISATVFGTSWYGNNYDPDMATFVDWIGVMTYDFTGSWNQSPVGPHSAMFKIRNPQMYLEQQQGSWPNGMDNNPITSLEESLWYWSNPYYSNFQGKGSVVPRQKLVLGIPLYGYDFAYGKGPDPVTGDIPPGYYVYTYKQIMKYFPDSNRGVGGNIKIKGSTQRPSFINASGKYPYQTNIYYDSRKTAVEKLLFSRYTGCQGVLLWDITSDDESNSVIDELFRNSGNYRRWKQSSAKKSEKLQQLDMLGDPIEADYTFLSSLDKFLKKDVNWTATAIKDNGFYLCQASAGVGVDKNLFFTIKAEAKASVFGYVYNKTGGANRIYDVSIQVFKVSASAYIGMLTGYEFYAALVDGSLGVFDVRIATGLSSEIGFKDTTLQMQVGGMGLMVGRRVGLKIFDSYIAVDLSKLFTEEGALFLIQLANPLLLGIDLLTKQRSVKGRIRNKTPFNLTNPQKFFLHGELKTKLKNTIYPGETFQFFAGRTSLFYGVQGIITYRMPEMNMNFVFFLSNPFSGSNHIQFYANDPRIMGGDLFHQAQKRSRKSDQIHRYQDEDFIYLYRINSGNATVAYYDIIDMWS